ncbi:MauE/DoxX family redox-associated membrane protein [Chitinophaga caseinilytica]|uniref:MauE/DoxX family redox-associated membrane protein n=1 Tax=Chitinophaga caseinilytica TaxID=2267521 RepID=A0ABZ2Z9S2_9BACT
MLKNVTRKIRISQLCLELIVALLIILWVYTSISKIFDFSNFKTQLGLSPFISGMSGFLSFAIPTGELLLALLLVIKKTRIVGLYASFALMLMFTIYIYMMLQYAYDLPCSCGGVLAKMTWSDHLYFNGAFTIAALIGVLIVERKVYVLKTA